MLVAWSFSDLSGQKRDDGFGVGQVWDRGGGRVRAKFVDGETAGGDGEGAGADGFAAFDVVRCVADDPDPIGRKFDGVMRGGATERVRAELVAQLGVVGEGAEREVRPEIVMAELDFGAAAKVAGEETLGDISASGEGGEKFADAGEHVGVRIRELAREGGEIVFEITGDVVGRVGKRELGEHAAGDPRIGAAGDLDVLKRADDTEGAVQGGDECALAGVAGENEGAVDVPENEGFHANGNLRRDGSAGASKS